MNRLRVLFVAVAASILVFAAYAAAARTVVSGTGVLIGSGTSYALTVRNTSTAGETVKCIRYFTPAGTTITGVTGLGSPTSFGTGFGAQNLAVAPGASSTFAFTTSQPLSASSSGSLRLSADCVTDVTGTLSGPVAPPTATPPPCNCVTLYGRVVPKTIKLTNPGEQGILKMEFSVAWFMNCLPGSGGCVGQLELSPPQPAVVLKARLKPISGRIRCVTDCGTSKSGVMHFTLVVGRLYGHDARRGRSLTLSVKRTCQGKAQPSQTFVFVFNKIGLVDKKKSRFK